MSDDVSRIRMLPDGLISQIAAGEVIERPASVVKELLDNSLDAGASRITVDVERGGTQLIRVNDNGSGIRRADLSLALGRHATSKIQALRDLEQVTTLGFRGEALSSIASVSRLVLSSRSHDDDHGWRIRSECSHPRIQTEPIAHPPGTTIEVRELFFNIPARRKFLRSERTEFQQILKVIRRCVVGRCDVTLKFTHNNRQVLRAAADTQHPVGKQRRRDVCGAVFSQHSIHLEQVATGLRVSGWVGLPAASSRDQENQYLFINRRWVRDRHLNHAIRRAYADRLDDNLYPTYILNLDIDPHDIDVNVHPTKSEVRFKHSRTVHDFVYSALHQALEKSQGIALHHAPGGTVGTNIASLKTSSKIKAAQSCSRTANTQPSHRSPLAPDTLSTSATAQPAARTPADAIREVTAPYQARSTLAGFTESSTDGTPMGVIGNRYLLVKEAAALIIVDVLNATRGLWFARLKGALAQRDVASQPLLIPVTVELEASEVDTLEGNAALLKACGFGISRAGPSAVRVLYLPTSLDDVVIPRLLEDVVASLKTPLSIDAIDPLLYAVSKHIQVQRPLLASAQRQSELLSELKQRAPQGYFLGQLGRVTVCRHLPIEQLAELLEQGGNSLDDLD